MKKEKQQRLVTNFTSAIIIISLQCNIIHCPILYKEVQSIDCRVLKVCLLFGRQRTVIYVI